MATEEPQSIELATIASEARARLPGIADHIERIARTVDPIELVAQMTLLYQTHPAHEQPNRDEMARWQAKIEWLAWLLFSRHVVAPPEAALIDARVLEPLEKALEDYFVAVSLTLMARRPDLSKAQDDIRSDLEREALLVRGQGFLNELEALAVEIYSPHDEWCQLNLGLTVRDAFAVAKLVSERFSDTLQTTREVSHAIQDRVRENPAAALEVDGLPPALRDALAEALPDAGSDDFARTVSMAWFFPRARAIVGFTEGEIEAYATGKVAPERIEAFLALMSTTPDAIQGEPNPLALTPLAKSPLVFAQGRFYLFVPGVLFEPLLYAFHARLFGAASYRPVYDDARAKWLEQSSIGAFRRLIPNADVSGWGLVYGPKKSRFDLDGLLLYDNKLILFECKWKSPTLVALGGDVDAILADVDKGIIEPLRQAKRARDYIRQRGETEFVEKSSGRRIVVRSADVAEVFLVTLVGSGAWAQIAANLRAFAPLGLFSDGEFPWALSLSDLRVISACLQLPSQLFDYLRRRDQVQRDGRFHLHDEWDYLGAYLSGALDPDDPRFPKDVNLIVLDGFDSGLQEYHHALSNPDAPPVEKPRRNIPDNVFELLSAAEGVRIPGKSDAVCTVLGWSDDGLAELSKMLSELRRKAIWDGRSHAVGARHPWKRTGITLACGYRGRRAIQATLLSAIRSQRSASEPEEWAGFGLELAAPHDPLVMYYSQPV
jgi:hypothetical protein